MHPRDTLQCASTQQENTMPNKIQSNRLRWGRKVIPKWHLRLKGLNWTPIFTTYTTVHLYAKALVGYHGNYVLCVTMAPWYFGIMVPWCYLPLSRSIWVIMCTLGGYLIPMYYACKPMWHIGIANNIGNILCLHTNGSTMCTNVARVL